MVKKISEYEYKRADVGAAIAFLDGAVKKANAATDVVALAATRDEVNAYFADFYTFGLHCGYTPYTRRAR